MYTSCNLCPNSEVPVNIDQQVVEAIIKYLEPAIVERLVIFDTDGETEIYEEENVGSDRAIRLWLKYEPIHSYFAFGECKLVRGLLDEIEQSIPEMTTIYMPWRPMLATGPTELTDIDDDEIVIARSNIEFSLSGDGIPDDCSAYLSRFKTLQSAQQLKQFMEQLTGCSWQWLMTSS